MASDQEQAIASQQQLVSAAFYEAQAFVQSNARVEDYFVGYSTAEIIAERLTQLGARIAAVNAWKTDLLKTISTARGLDPQTKQPYTEAPDSGDSMYTGE